MTEPCKIDITIEETPVEVFITEQNTTIDITEEQTIIRITPEEIKADIIQQDVNIVFADPDKVGPQGPAGRGVAVLSEADDPCGVDATLGPVLAIKKVLVDGCYKYKLLIVDKA